MRFQNVSIEGLQYVDGPIRVESELLESGFADTLQRLGHRPGLLRKLTGVVARRFFDEHLGPSDVATAAAKSVLESTGIDKDDIGLLISTSVSKDYVEPSIASTVHGNLGLGASCLNFDVGNACLAFLNAMEVAGMMIERGQVSHAMVVVGESSRTPVENTVRLLSQSTTTEQDLRNHFATLTLGSGGVAMILSHVDHSKTTHRFLGGVNVADTSHNHLCRGQYNQMITDAGGLLNAGVDVAKRTFEQAGQHLGWAPNLLNVIVMHQVGSVHFSTILKTLGLDMNRAHVTYPEFGNMGPASIPVTLGKAIEAGQVKQGDRVALMGIGSGLNCSMMEAVW